MSTSPTSDGSSWKQGTIANRKSSQERYQCPRCPNSFKRPEHLKRHQRGHDGYKRFICPTCSKRFTRSDILSRHQAMHLALERTRSSSTATNAGRKRACGECAKARERCSRDEPCLRCSSKALTCEYPYELSRRVRSASTPVPSSRVDDAASELLQGSALRLRRASVRPALFADTNGDVMAHHQQSRFEPIPNLSLQLSSSNFSRQPGSATPIPSKSDRRTSFTSHPYPAPRMLENPSTANHTAIKSKAEARAVAARSLLDHLALLTRRSRAPYSPSIHPRRFTSASMPVGSPPASIASPMSVSGRQGGPSHAQGVIGSFRSLGQSIMEESPSAVVDSDEEMTDSPQLESFLGLLLHQDANVKTPLAGASLDLTRETPRRYSTTALPLDPRLLRANGSPSLSAVNDSRSPPLPSPSPAALAQYHQQSSAPLSTAPLSTAPRSINLKAYEVVANHFKELGVEPGYGDSPLQNPGSPAAVGLDTTGFRPTVGQYDHIIKLYHTHFRQGEEVGHHSPHPT